MPLNKDETELFEHLCYEKQAPIEEKYHAELERIDHIADINKHPQYLKAIKDFAREMIDARVSAYIETYKQAEKYPTEEDFGTFGHELKEIAIGFKDIFARRYNRPLSYPYPQEWVDAVLVELSMELAKANGYAIIPLRRFISEEKVKENLPPKTFKEVKERAEGKAIEKAYPRNKRTRNVLYIITGIIVIALGLIALKQAFLGQSNMTKVTSPLTVTPEMSATATPEPSISPTPNQTPTPKFQPPNVSGTYKGEIVGELWLKDNLVGDARTLDFSIDFAKSLFCDGGLEGNAKWVSENVAEYQSPDKENPCRLTFFFSNRKVRVRESQCNADNSICKFNGVYIRE
jgi:hypothetical protein